MSNNIPCLTGGILFGLILEARKSSTRVRSRELDKNDGLTEVNIMLSLLEIFNGGPQLRPQGTSLKKDVSQYKKCELSSTTYLPFDNQKSIASFADSVKQNKKDTLNRMSTFISDKFAESRLEWFVSAIIETISNDKTIDASEYFRVSINSVVSKSELSNVTTIEIESFLLDVMRYIFVNKIDNELGKSTFKSWYSQSGIKTQWKFINSELGKHLPKLEITRYATNIANTEERTDSIEEQEHTEEVPIETEDRINLNVETDESMRQQELKNSAVVNQYANDIYNIKTANNIINNNPSRAVLSSDGFYNLFVKYDEEYEGTCFTIRRDRMLNGTPEHIRTKFSKFSFDDVEEIVSLPALFLPEYKNNKEIPFGYLGRLREINIPKYGDPVFHFKTTKSVPVDWVNLHKDELMIAPFELENTHWAIKRANLMNVLEVLTDGSETE